MSNAEFIFGALRAWFLNPLWNLLLVNLSTLSLFCVSSSHLHGPNIVLLLERWWWTKHSMHYPYSAESTFRLYWFSHSVYGIAYWRVVTLHYIRRITTIETLVHFTYCRFTGNLPKYHENLSNQGARGLAELTWSFVTLQSWILFPFGCYCNV